MRHEGNKVGIDLAAQHTSFDFEARFSDECLCFQLLHLLAKKTSVGSTLFRALLQIAVDAGASSLRFWQAGSRPYVFNAQGKCSRKKEAQEERLQGKVL